MNSSPCPPCEKWGLEISPVHACLRFIPFSLELLVGLTKKNFTIGATTHVECFNVNCDMTGHVMWQPCWKKGETDLYL